MLQYLYKMRYIIQGMEAPICPICLDDSFIPNRLLKSGKFKYECQCECHKETLFNSSELVRKDLLSD